MGKIVSKDGFEHMTVGLAQDLYALGLAVAVDGDAKAVIITEED